MSEGALFNPVFFGSQDGRWIGQVADDSTWRDNMLPGKFESANTIPGPMPAKNILSTDSSTTNAYTIIGIEGGIKIPNVPPAAKIPKVKFL